MRNSNSAQSFTLKRLKALALAVGFGAVLGAGGLSQSAHAATPAANASIKNQATASYTDNSGVQQTTTSNTVETTIQQVGSFTLSPPTATPSAVTGAGYTKQGAPGAILYAQYTLTNTGNGTDTFTITATDKNNTGTFSSVAIYPDVNSSGQPSSTTAVTAPVSVGAGGSYSFVVAYSIPSSASGTWTDQADVKVTAAGSTLGYPNLTLTRTDTVNATTNAAFSVTKSFWSSTSAAPSYWTNPSAFSSGSAPNNGKLGSYTAYTINYVNNGGTAGPVYIKDLLPPGFTYVNGTGTWNVTAGALSDSDSTNPTGISYKVGTYSPGTGTLIEAIVQNVQPGQSGSISFEVLASAGAAGVNTSVGKTTTNNVASFTANGFTASGSCVAPSTNFTLQNCSALQTNLNNTNAVPFDVLPSRGVILTGSGDGGAAPATSGADATAATAGNAAGDAAGGADTVTVASAVPGSAARYTFKVYNKGNAQDTFLLSLSTATGANTFPVGTTFNWFQSDGLTPLLASSGSTVDTGPIAANANLTVVLQVVVPAGTAAPQTGAPLYTATVQAISANDSTIEDGAKAQLTALSAGFVDLTQTSASGTAGLDQGPGTNTVVQAIAVTAGGAGNNSTAAVGPTPAPAASTLGSAVFTLNVKNNDSSALTFNLLASSTSSFPNNLPSGWTVDFYSDAAATTPLAGGTVGARTTPSISAGSSLTVYAKVTPPSNAAANTYDVYFEAKSTANASSGALVSDYLHDQVVVAVAGSFNMVLASSGSMQAAGGGSATYPHSLTNKGSFACGTVAAPLSLSVTGLPSGWTYSVYLDTGVIGSIDGESAMVGTGTNGSGPYSLGVLPVGGNVPLLVRVFPPAGTVAGTTAVATVTVTDPAYTTSSGTTGCAPTIVSDTTTVSANGQVEVKKYQTLTSGACGTWVEPTLADAITTAKPGDCLMYKSVAKNLGTTAVTGVTLNDKVPGYTTWAATQPSGANPACESSTGSSVALSTVAANAVSGTTFSCGTETSLPPNGTMTLRFSVQIDN